MVRDHACGIARSPAANQRLGESNDKRELTAMQQLALVDTPVGIFQAGLQRIGRALPQRNID